MCFDRAACLALGADEEHIFAFADSLGNEFLRQQETLDCLADVDDVNLILDTLNVGGHLWIPTRSALTEVDSCFNEFVDK